MDTQSAIPPSTAGIFFDNDSAPNVLSWQRILDARNSPSSQPVRPGLQAEPLDEQ